MGRPRHLPSRRRARLLRLRRGLPVLVALAVGGACGSAAARMPVDVPPGAAPTADALVEADVGRLLGPDVAASREALRALVSLDPAGVAALSAHARRIPNERDPRWLEALDAHGLLPALTPEQRLAWALWQGAEPAPGRVMAGQSRLVELARTSPSLLIARLAAVGSGRDAIAIALADAGRVEAVPALLALYRSPASPRERRGAALALGRLAGDDLRPRADGTAEDVEADAGRIEAWWRARKETVDARRPS